MRRKRVRPITKSILFTSLSKSVLSLNFFVIYNSGTINPLTPGAFCKKGVSWSFWWFLGWISAKLALIWSNMHHDSLAFLPLASCDILTRACAEIIILGFLAFSSPEPTILLACGRNRELWEQPFQTCAIDVDAQ